METHAAEFREDGNKIVWDFRENVALFDFYGAPAAAKFVFKLLSMYDML